MNLKNSKIHIDMRQYGMIIVLIAIFLLFSLLTGGINASAMNINNLMMQNGYIIILSVGMLLCVLTGNIDLGVGSVVAVSGAVSAIMIVDLNLPIAVGFLMALVVGCAFGLFVGFFVAYLGVPPFIVTLATMLIGRGLTYTVLRAQTKGPLPDSYTWVGAGCIPSHKIGIFGSQLDIISILIAVIVTGLIIFNVFNENKKRKHYGFETEQIWQEIITNGVIIALLWYIMLKFASYKGIPNVMVLTVIVIIFYHFITQHTVYGRDIYALGGNRKAAQLSGVNTKRVFFWVYANMGLLSGLAGIVLSARNASATPKAGDGFELDAIAACYIGGAAVSGGAGTIIGAVVGALIMGILNNGMSLCGMSTDIQKIVKGLVLLGAVTVDLLSKQNKTK
jgi:putative multiple sugar transport system permease protein